MNVKQIERDNQSNQEKIKKNICEIQNKNIQLDADYQKELKKYNDLKKKKEEMKEAVKTYGKIFIIISAILVVLIMIFVPLCVMSSKSTDFSNEHEFLYGVLCMSGILGGIALIAEFIAAINFFGVCDNCSIYKKKFEKAAIPQKPETLIVENDPQYIETEQKINENIELIAQIKKESDEKTIDNRKIVNAISKNALEMYNAVAREFKMMLPNLDIRDYRNVDLIIYLLETGRAETMKEALQQVDTYIHTDRIVKAISDASKTISQSIRLNSMAIQQTIKETSFELGNKLDRIAYNVNAMSDRQSALMKELNESVSRTNSVVEMQNALLEKASVSSSEMAENIDRMRYYADQEYIRNANKW